MSQLTNAFDKVREIILHYGMTIETDIARFRRHKDIDTYYMSCSSGMIFFTVDLNTFDLDIQFNGLFQSVKPNESKFDENKNSPLLIKHYEAFLKDKEIFNAFVTQHDDDYTFKRNYGYLLDLLDVSLVFKINGNDTHFNENDFVIRYHTLQSCSKMLMLEQVSYLQYENTYDFYYKDCNLVYDGDYKQLHNTIIEAYHLDDSKNSKTFTNFKDLAQLTLMKIY